MKLTALISLFSFTEGVIKIELSRENISNVYVIYEQQRRSPAQKDQRTLVHCIDNTMSIVAISEISRLLLLIFCKLTNPV